MGLSNKTIEDFVKLVNSDKTNKSPTESTVTATAVELDGRTYVRIDGSDLLTPVAKTTSVKEGDKVTVLVKQHTATITGNLSDPSASSTTVSKQGNKITELEIVMAYKVTTEDLEAVNASIENLRATAARLEDATIVNAQIENLEAMFAQLDHITATDIEVITAQIETIQAEFANIKDISTEDLDAVNAEITNLKGYTADFTYVTADVLEAMEASIKILETEKLSADEADIKYANIDFTNITQAAMEYFYANSGLIRDVIINEGTITGHLVGVTITGDLIEGGTIVADKLVIQGDDGLYYRLNMSAYDTVHFAVVYDPESDSWISTEDDVGDVQGDPVEGVFTTDGDQVCLYVTEDGGEIYYVVNIVYNGEKVDVEQVPRDTLNGNIITANSITAEKINVSDLVAFDATIGGFKIGEKSIYSGVKESVHNTTKGIYMDSEGHFNAGDGTHYLKFYEDQNGVYRLAIAADSIIFSDGGNDLADLVKGIKIDTNLGTIKLGLNDEEMSLNLENDLIVFRKNGEQFGWWDGVDFHTGNIVVDVNERAQFGNFAWLPRNDQSLMFLKVSDGERTDIIGKAVIGTATVH